MKKLRAVQYVSREIYDFMIFTTKYVGKVSYYEVWFNSNRHGKLLGDQSIFLFFQIDKWQ